MLACACGGVTGWAPVGPGVKIAPPVSQDALEELRERLQCGLPRREGWYWTVMIYRCRWGCVARAQLRPPRGTRRRRRLVGTRSTASVTSAEKEVWDGVEPVPTGLESKHSRFPDTL
jgi:hypothetical protein